MLIIPINYNLKKKDLGKSQVIDKDLHKINQRTLLDYTGEFEMVGKLSVGDQKVGLEILLIMKLILTLLMKEDLSLKTLLSMIIFIKSKLLSLLLLTEVNMVADWISKIKLWNTVERIVEFQLKVIVLSDVLIS